MESITLSQNFQIVIPDNILEKLHLQVGQQFICITENNTIRLIPKNDIQAFRGILKDANPENYRDRPEP
ncbi:MAG TPA: AbrB/MazE/SpoVT family DNA-binding domain-containing protein [Thiotrichaceae bacterium]|nr:AbrB/MazE/SpoVT family DNA-binding domain-containing protein [Thiotrichaceae bacterium]